MTVERKEPDELTHGGFKFRNWGIDSISPNVIANFCSGLDKDKFDRIDMMGDTEPEDTIVITYSESITKFLTGDVWQSESRYDTVVWLYPTTKAWTCSLFIYLDSGDPIVHKFIDSQDENKYEPPNWLRMDYQKLRMIDFVRWSGWAMSEVFEEIAKNIRYALMYERR